MWTCFWGVIMDVYMMIIRICPTFCILYCFQVKHVILWKEMVKTQVEKHQLILYYDCKSGVFTIPSTGFQSLSCMIKVIFHFPGRNCFILIPSMSENWPPKLHGGESTAILLALFTLSKPMMQKGLLTIVMFSHCSKH